MSKTRPTTLPGIPKVPITLAPEVRKYLEALSEVVEIRVGRKGDPRDRAITLRELIDSGLALELADTPFNPNAYNQNDLGFTQPAEDGGVMTPTAPTNFTVGALFETVNLSWDYPTYIGHAQTQIWRHTSNDLATAASNPGNNIGNLRGRFFVDNVGGGQTHYYWIRHENALGVVGPWNSASGTEGTTLQNIGFLLNALANQITTSQLASSLSSQITAIGQIPVWSTSNAYVVGDVVRTQAGLGADRLYVCIQNVSANTVGLGNASYWKIYGAYDELKSVTDTSTAAITAINTVTTGSGSAAAVAIAQAAARLNDVDGDSGGVTIETRMAAQATINSGHSAQYTVKIDNNGAIAGFGLASTTTASGNILSEFIVNADRFAIIGSSTTVTNATGSHNASVPFTVVTSTQTVQDGAGNNVTIQPGVYMNAAFIKNASIQSANIHSVNAATITTGFLGAGRIDANTIDASKLVLDNATMTATDINGTPTLVVNELNANVLTSGILNTSRINLDNATITADGSGQVKIKDLGVDTLQIKGQAVTIPSNATLASDLDLTSSSSTILSLTWTSTGAPTVIFVALHWSGTGQAGGYQGSGSLKHGATVVKTFKLNGTNNVDNQHTMMFNITPSAGSNTVSVVGQEGPGTAAITVEATNTSIFVLETKK